MDHCRVACHRRACTCSANLEVTSTWADPIDCGSDTANIQFRAPSTIRPCSHSDWLEKRLATFWRLMIQAPEAEPASPRTPLFRRHSSYKRPEFDGWNFDSWKSPIKPIRHCLNFTPQSRSIARTTILLLTRNFPHPRNPAQHWASSIETHHAARTHRLLRHRRAQPRATI